jgi:polyphosphate glucokinase
MKVLVIDIGGTHVKVLATGHDAHREFVSGPTLTPVRMVTEVRKVVKDWKYDVVSIGYPGPVLHNRPVLEPWNLGKGWCGFNFERAFHRPVKVVNDAAMQALGSYKGGKMLFLGLGTGLGSALIVNKIVEPLELGHLPYKKATFEDYVGIRGLEKYGKKKWRRFVADVVERLIAAIEPDEVVLGGGNVKKLKRLPSGCRGGDNADAFRGGFRLWERSAAGKSAAPSKRRPKQRTLAGPKFRKVAKAPRAKRGRPSPPAVPKTEGDPMRTVGFDKPSRKLVLPKEARIADPERDESRSK